MIFTSLEFAGFVALVVILNWLLPKPYRPALLLVGSYLFYATWSVPAISVLFAITVITYFSALAIPKLEGGARTALTTFAVLCAAGTLVAFKAIEALGFQNSDNLPGIGAKLVVPVGLSFFAFQAISYVVDVNKRTVEPTRSPIDVALYLAFFPHLLAGPIVRAAKLIPAFHAVSRWPEANRTQEGLELILVGVFKKVALADPVFAQIGTALTDPQAAGRANALMAQVMLLVAAYLDITAYVDIARGVAKLLGIDMQRNALYPLTKTRGYGDFWRRWQLTIMMWFRDYIFRPLRGTGRQEWREDAALFGTFFALGIWHGFTAGWFLWGIASGLIIVTERRLQSRRAKKRRAQTVAARQARKRSMLPKDPPAWRSHVIGLLLVLATFPLVSAPSLSGAFDQYKALFTADPEPFHWNLLLMGLVAIAGVIVLDRREERREARAGKSDPMVLPRALAFGAMVAAIIVFSGPTPKTFLYFAF
ncbi:MBOAT family O-acyltransferase [Aquihabitans daechungensis]|uniref:MBOAT family O-acyltransferase n=1 Tax=Aquihabitans daechungensis TaxID=1052257 RepID=UPI003BA0EF87